MIIGIVFLLGAIISACYIDFHAGDIGQSVIAPIAAFIFSTFSFCWALSKIHKDSEINRFIPFNGADAASKGNYLRDRD